jgi:hypothetical protein
MKKYFFVFLVLALFFSNTALATTSGDYVYLASYEEVSFIPETINTGDLVSMTVDIKNRGSYLSITDLNAELILDSGLEAVNTNYYLDEINSGTTKKIVFDFKVSEDSLPGNYHTTLKLTYVRDGDTIIQSEEIIVAVANTEKKLDISLTPSVISPGTQQILVFKITNLTNKPISNLSFMWQEANNLLLPLGTDNKRFVSYIGANESVEVEYLAAADPNTVTGIYPLTTEITMNDNDGVITQESTIGILLGGTTEFETSIDESDSLISINIANIGANDAESVILKATGTGLIISNNTVIVGNIDRGDYTVASFEATQMNAKEMTLEISYTDTTGGRQTITKNLELASANSMYGDGNFEMNPETGNVSGTTGMPSGMRGEFGTRSTQSSFPMTELIALIVVVIVGAVAYKKRNFIRLKIKEVKKIRESKR